MFIKFFLFFFFIFVLFHLTFGYTIRSFESKFYNTFSKDKITFIKDKIREEMKNSIKKDKILYEDDALLINKFINKIVSEIK